MERGADRVELGMEPRHAIETRRLAERRKRRGASMTPAPLDQYSVSEVLSV